MIIYNANSNYLVKSRTASTSYSIEPKSIVNSGSLTIIESFDAIINHYEAASVVRSFRIVPSKIQKTTYESLNLSTATVDQNGYVNWVSDGNARIQVCTYGQKNLIVRRVEIEGGQQIDQLNSWKTGSLAKNISDFVDFSILNKPPTQQNTNLFTSVNHTTSKYTRNNSVWTGLQQQWTCVSVWNSQFGPNFPATLITPRHAICGKHIGINVGQTIRWVTAGNVVVNRTVSAVWDHPVRDIRVLLLNSIVGSTITPCKIPTDNLREYLVELRFRVPCVQKNQFNKITTFDLFETNPESAIFRIPINPKRLEFYETLITGDSGEPCFMIINNEFCLITTWLTPNQGPKYYQLDWGSIIFNLDSQVGSPTGLLPQTINLNSFNRYGP